MEKFIEEDRDDLKDIDEFFSCDSHENGSYDELETFATNNRRDELSDYANDIRNNLKEILSGMQTREPRYKLTRT